ncbi:MAG: circularly permuted type 2 ATP-grasp protein [Rubrivivax sp.]|nr:circularly permuted type 2 ATP-grasp protein [Rubrivivax sp.]
MALLRRAWPPDLGVYDELRDTAGRVRPAWSRMLALMPPAMPGHDGAATLERRAAQVAERIRQDGVTHNVFSETGVAARPWSLELLPMIIDAADWARIERGVAQRAALLQTLLDDVYGPQRVLHEGLLPPALVLRHPGYQRPLQGVQAPGGQRLFIVAFDIARALDGSWWVMAQRTQGPSGLGYVMHNRLIISRQFPEAFRELQVQHLASGFRRLLDTLEVRAREVAGGQTPRIVLLTPGLYSETYFEHAYLARYLGLPLVEGGDLTVLGENLYLKTVEGLQPVHGVMRRLDDDFCDPLELRPDSALGVPGLLQVARAGNVVLANALGSAFLESPAVLGFLPGIAERLTGQSLEMPSVPTWWCGEPAAWADVRQQAEGKVLRSTFPKGSRTSQVHAFSEELVESDPEAWTLQARLRFSRAPIWGQGAVQPRPALVRVYAVADAGGRWHVLPGGMTRVAPREDASLSMQRGGSSLDTWVLTDGAVDTYSMLPQRLSAAEIERRTVVVSSRTAENLFWMGRYTERTEQLVRLARVLLQVIDSDNDADVATLQALSSLAVHSGLAPEGVPTLVQSEVLFQRALLAALPDGEAAFSIAFNLRSLENTAQALRERLSAEQFGLMRLMREGFSFALDASTGRVPGMLLVMPALDRLALQLAAATGAQTDRMTRDHGWRLLTVGRLLERLLGLCARLERFAGTQALASSTGVELLLDLFDSAITFRSRYQRHDDLLALAELLVIDNANPRALAGVLRRLRTELRNLPGDAAWHQQLIGRLPTEGAGLTLAELDGCDDPALLRVLREQVARLHAAALSLAEDIAHRYFTLPGGADVARRV